MGAGYTDKRLEKRYRRIAFFSTGMYLLLPPLIGWIVGLVADFGRGVDGQFFAVVAEGLLPVLLITVVLQSTLITRRELELDPSPLTEWRARKTLSAAFALFIVSEGVVLYAIGASTSSTFLVVTPLVAGLFFLGDLSYATRNQFGSGIEKYLPSKMIESMAKRERAVHLETADRLQRRADALREEAESIPKEE
jgi:MFS family permease